MKPIVSLTTIVVLLRTQVLGQSVQADANGPNLVLSSAPQYNGYGINYPNGLAATRYLFSPSGTWRSYSGLRHVYSYYGNDQERQQLINYANGARPATCYDLDGTALFGFARDEVTSGSGRAFMDHNGRGEGGGAVAQPFSQFWHDHNKVAYYMTSAYGAPPPIGLVGRFSRYQSIGYETAGWQFQSSNSVEGILVNGLYFLATRQFREAINTYDELLRRSGAYYDSGTQRYQFPNFRLSYYLGLFKIFSDRFLDSGAVESNANTNVIQYSMSLRSLLLQEQQIENGNPIGWTIGRTRQDGVTVINTHTTAVNVLALGAASRYSWEVGVSPMYNPNGFFYRSDQRVLSAVRGQSPAGIMVYGPYTTLPTGTYTVDWYLRTGNSRGILTAYLDAYDSNTGQTLTAYEVTAKQWPANNAWGRFSNTFTVQNANNRMEFRVTWRGQADMDVGEIKIR